MVKHFKRMILGSLVSIITGIAALSVTPACVLNLHQPEVPAELRK